MADLHARARAFLQGPSIIGDPSHRLVHRYVAGQLSDDPETRDLLLLCLADAHAEAARFKDATVGPARDARCFYQRAAELLRDIKAEMSARQQ
jgi:hypothetical protein